jgi:hypothetical protein
VGTQRPTATFATFLFFAGMNLRAIGKGLLREILLFFCTLMIGKTKRKNAQKENVAVMRRGFFSLVFPVFPLDIISDRSVRDYYTVRW